MFKGTTILAIKHKGEVAISGDGQISMGNTIMKNNTKKIPRNISFFILTTSCDCRLDSRV